jgi:Domain of unknown function (DUF4173)
MISIPIARPSIPFGIRGTLLGAGVAVTALADWLFYMHVPGISVVIFLAALCAAALVTNRVGASRAELAAAMTGLAVALLPALEDFGLLSLVFAVCGACAFALLAIGWPARPAVERLTDVGWMIVSGAFRLAADLGCAIHAARQRDLAKHGANWVVAWIVPVGLGGIFLLLFWQANPLIGAWLTSVDTSRWKNLDLVRPLFWLAVIASTWPFLQVRIGGKPTMQDLVNILDPSPTQSPPLQSPTMPSPAATATTARAANVSADGPLFGRTAILRSLVLFNALFAVQSALDITYLWGGLALPAGMSYASYAHRGAYPLIVTALLAGAFVLAAMQPGTSIERSRLARALVFLWIGQNVLLVLSSMLRLDLYVDIYSLTEWRCAAFVWMLLVAAGLVLIVARIILDRSNRWLVWSNAAVLVLTLYACSLIDFSGVIARFNVDHSWEAGGAGEPVDMAYLCGLGPAALPALDVLAAKASASGRRLPGSMYDCRRSLEMRHAMRMGDWRAWTFRGYRLKRFLYERDARSVATGVRRSMV